MNSTSSSRGVAAGFGLALYPFVLTLPLFAAQDAGPVVRAVLVAFTAVLLVGVVRRTPLLGLAVILLGTVIAVGSIPSAVRGDYDARQVMLFAFVSADVALGYLVAARPRPQWITGAVLSALVQAVTIAGFAHASVLGAWTMALLALLVSCMIGLLGRERREHAGALRAREVTEAVTAERLRIARELHDMVSHSIGVIAIQSGVASRVIETQPAEARAALEAIEATSRETLAELRRTLVSLRKAEPGAEAPLTPGGGLGDLDRLTRDAGVDVEVTRKGTERALPHDVDLAAYRIVQESLTNVVRHAGVDACRVLVSYGDDELCLEIVDSGAAASVTVPGMGITGMAERVSLLGGEFDAGRRPGGGFRVTARIPLSGAAR
ncbi:sensor histidine kinase [Streptomyces sp. NPDC052225]|uniref:sensor histidine kinase n=1 Tax=Streptomyces sp. NPDC052225 TaxID=3154949 RepID=UPI00341874FE